MNPTALNIRTGSINLNRKFNVCLISTVANVLDVKFDKALLFVLLISPVRFSQTLKAGALKIVETLSGG